MKKALKYSFVGLMAALGILVYLSWTPDIPHEVLADKYAVGASDFIELPSGARAHYRMQGNEDGKTIVLLHGSNASLHTWEPWVELLDDRFMVITVDLPGHGLTGTVPSGDYTYAGMTVFLNEFLTSLGVEHFVLGGNSMGGGVSMHYALAYPTGVDALILLDAAGAKAAGKAIKQTDLPLAFKLAGHWYSNWILEHITPRSIVSEGLEKGFTDHSLITDEMVDRYWELTLHPGNRYATGLRFASYRTSANDIAAEDINVPTLILWGEDDRLIPLDVGYALKERIAGSQLVVFPNVGHVPMEEIPEKSAAAAAKFVMSLGN